MFHSKEIRELVRIVARHSNISRAAADELYSKYSLFAGGRDWRFFLDRALLGIGAAFLLSGVIFFFAYNWAYLPDAAKIGITEVLMVATAAYGIFSRKSELVKKVCIMAASVLTGALFAVYGQVYQTGADAYDFFLGWGCAILLWSIVSGFPAQWLLQSIIIDLVILLYTQQVGPEWEAGNMLLLLFIIHLVQIVVLEIFTAAGKLPEHSGWMVKTMAVLAAGFLTSATIIVIMGEGGQAGIIWVLTLIALPGAAWYGVTRRNLFYPALVPLCFIVIVCALMVKAMGDDPVGMFLLAALFVIASVTGTTYALIKLNRKWHEENS